MARFKDPKFDTVHRKDSTTVQEYFFNRMITWPFDLD